MLSNIHWLEIVFWLSIAGLVYIYTGYPLLIAGLARCFPLQRTIGEVHPTVSVVLAVYNDAARLPAKIHSLLAMEQAELITEILVGSDGSSDNIEAVLQNLNEPRVRCVSFLQRRGKPAVINDLIRECRGEIVLLTDARQEFDRDFLRYLLPNFHDPRVGVVSGELVLRSSSTSAAVGIGFYWKYEKLIRRCESRFRGVPGATGACYAIRRAAFQPIPAGTILDDVAIPLQIVGQGKLCLFESKAIAYDEASQSAHQESIRKRRTIAGAAQLAVLFPHWCLPGGNPLWFEVLSHKLLRLCSPLLLVSALLTNIALASIPPYGVGLSLQLSLYVLAGCGWWYQSRGWKSSFFGTAYMFVALNWTTAVALSDALRARYQVTWQKAA